MRYIDVPPRHIRRRRLLVFLPVIVLFIFLYVIGYKDSATHRKANSFVNSVNSIVSQSNYLGKQFRAALNTNSKSKFLSENLNNLVDQNLSLSQRTAALSPPDGLKLAHSFLVVSMKLRHQGLEKYSRPKISIITSDKTKTDNAIKEALNDISLSDIAYKYYLQETRIYLNSINVKRTLIPSVYLPSKLKEQKTTKTLKKKNSSQISDIFIDDVATVPLRVSYNPSNETRVLPNTNSVKVRIKVGNKSKEKESDIPVEVSLYNGKKLKTKKDGIINSIKAGKTAKITIDGFYPDKKGLNTFKIKAGPLLSENNKKDNNYTYKFIFQSENSPPKNSN